GASAKVEEHEEQLEITSKSIIDLAWLRESIQEVQKKGLSAFTDESLFGYMKSSYKIEGKDIYDIASRLDKGKAQHFTDVIQDALNKP
ncbi:hypothetical protein LCGC14_3017290, partial [marine sediment metagenome]